jgi:hypothetical protein
MLKSGGNNPQIEYILKIIRKWGKDNNVKMWGNWIIYERGARETI